MDVKNFTKIDVQKMYEQETGNVFCYADDYFQWLENYIIDLKNQEIMEEVNEQVNAIVKENAVRLEDINVCDCIESCEACTCHA